MKVTFAITPTLDQDKRARTIFSDAGKFLGTISPDGKGRFYTDIRGMKREKGSRKSLVESVKAHFESL